MSGSCERLTIGLLRRAAAAESHDDGREGEASLHAVLPDALQDVEREVDVQVAQEHDAVAVLQEEVNHNASSRSPVHLQLRFHHSFS